MSAVCKCTFYQRTEENASSVEEFCVVSFTGSNFGRSISESLFQFGRNLIWNPAPKKGKGMLKGFTAHGVSASIFCLVELFIDHFYEGIWSDFGVRSVR
jgi:hypothetical protein